MTTLNPTAQPVARIDWSVLRDVTWWGWVALVVLLTMKFATGRPDAVNFAVAICLAFVVADLILRRGDWRTMGVQIRVGYVLLLLIGLLPWMAWLHMAQLAGTGVRVITGYCLFTRELRLLPWNWVEALTLNAAWKIFAAPPGAGGLLRLNRDSAESSTASCGLGSP